MKDLGWMIATLLIGFLIGYGAVKTVVVRECYALATKQHTGTIDLWLQYKCPERKEIAGTSR